MISSGSEGMNVDEKKRKRMISNRESARRSRMKKQKLLEDLVTEVASLKVEIHRNSDRYEVLMQKTAVLESENNALKAQQMELAEYLSNLEMMQNQMESLQFNLMKNNDYADQGRSFVDQILDIKEPPIKAWQCFHQPAIMASTEMFKI